jgi:hypothetical protein
VLVEGRDGRGQFGRVDAALACELGNGPSALEVARTKVGPNRDRERFGHTERVAAFEGVVADQPGLNRLVSRSSGQHGAGELVVAVGLVDEPLAVGQHGDQAGFAAVDDVRVGADPAVAVGHQ